MAREAEGRAWVHRHRRMIHNQTLIQLLNVVVLIVPFPLAALFFWVLFDLDSPIIVQSVAVLWGSSAVIYGALDVYGRIKQRNA